LTGGPASTAGPSPTTRPTSSSRASSSRWAPTPSSSATSPPASPGAWRSRGPASPASWRSPSCRSRGGDTRIRTLKGVILAGGTGSRLHPLTLITNKHLLPIYDRPMVTYAIEALVKAGVTELMLVTGGKHAGEVFRLPGNGHDHGNDPRFAAYQD